MNQKKSQLIFLSVIGIIMVLTIAIIFGAKMVQGLNKDKSVIPYNIAVTFCGDTKTNKGFSWYTDLNSKKSDVQIVKYIDSDITFDTAFKYEGSTTMVENQMPEEINSTQKEPKLKKITHILHQVVVKDLELGVKYAYRVGDASLNSWSASGTFETAPNENLPFTFISLTDTQGFDQKDYSVWKFVLDNAFEKYPQSKFIVNAGDFVEDDKNENQWKLFFDMPKDRLMNTTIVPAAGNHDNEYMMNHFTLTDEIEKISLLKGYYSYDYGDAHFTVLNTNDSNPEMSKTQLDWFKKDISSTDKKWKIVIIHKAVYTDANHINDKDIQALQSQLKPIFEEYEIDLVIQGHDHYYIRSYPMVGNKPSENEVLLGTFGGKSFDFFVNSKGPIYVMTSTSGNKSFDGVRAKDLDIQPALVIQPLKPFYAACTIENDKLVYEVYSIDKDTGKVIPIDTFGIMKS